MDPEMEKAIERHIRGATVVHESPFSFLEVPQIPDLLSEAECDKWVVPFYRTCFCFSSRPEDLMLALRQIYQELSPEIVYRLLADYNWRPRITAAYFASLKRYNSFEEQIGKLLLRSDLCFAGGMYCIALVEFNRPTGLHYLCQYLDYYLTRPDLHYDQSTAIGAIAFLDAKNNTDLLSTYKPLWKVMVGESWEKRLNDAIERFRGEMGSLHQCRIELENSLR